MKTIIFIILILGIFLMISFLGNANNKETTLKSNNTNMENTKKAYFAGGCFWCMEGIFEAQNGVVEAITGYAGGDSQDATYEKVSTGLTKHREAIEVIYDDKKISYETLVSLYFEQIDPTDPDGQFADKGFQYTTAIFYQNDKEKEIAQNAIKTLSDSKKFDKPIATKVLPFVSFYKAEEYHQDYYKKSAFHYNTYKKGSGREDYIEKTWKNNPLNNSGNYKNYSEDLVKSSTGRILLFFHADWCSSCQSLDKQIKEFHIPNDLVILKVDFDTQKELAKKYSILSQSSFVQIDKDGKSYKRWVGKSNIKDIVNETLYSEDIMKGKLTPLQYNITQNGGTEKPFDNEYWNNHEAGIYVDVVDGTPLFSSLDKFDSGTGWPSFTQPIDESMVAEKEDNKLASTRTEVKSKDSNSHLGHVFNDGPKDKGGLRYCINSASLRFVPVADLEKEGYSKYKKLFQK